MREMVGQLMKAAREKLDLNQADVGAMLRTSKGTPVQKNTISHWESAQNEPSIDQFIEWCKILNVDFREILRQAYGDPTQELQSIAVTADEAELIRKYRALDNRGRRVVLRNLNDEYDDYMKNLVEDSLSVGNTG